MAKVFSGIQPSGQIHIGNYFGAIKQQITMQTEHDCTYFIANLHALTTLKDPELLTQYTHDLVLDYLALGLDPNLATIFVQSAIPEHTELSWILSTICSQGILNRAHAWKDALAKGSKSLSIGLYTYPILMAADILLYQPDLVPVGQDQKQHLEITRDLANKFNETYNTDLFKLPEPLIVEEVATVPGTDGQKMSKSYNNTLPIFSEESKIKKAIMGIQTDSTSFEDPKNPDTCNVFQLYKLFTTKSEQDNLKDKYLAGNFGYGDAKKILLQTFLDYFQEAQEKRKSLQENPKHIQEILSAGNQKAKKQAQKTLQQVKSTIGLIY